MPEIHESAQQRMLVPVLIGGASMALISYLPILELINCACCAGIMGGAVLGVFFYKKTYPAEIAFGPKQGATIGALSGVVGAVLYALLFITLNAGGTSDFMTDFDEAFEQNREQMEAQGQDPESLEKVSELIRDIADSPVTTFAVTLGFSLLIFAGFGAIGGAIGGKIFKSDGVDPTLPPLGGSQEF